MNLPRPSLAGSRPAYLDNLFFRDAVPPMPGRAPPKSPAGLSTPSLRSANSSLSSITSVSSTDVRPSYAAPIPAPPMTPIHDYASSTHDDRISLRSIRLHLSPRFKLRKLLHRRAHPQVQETTDSEVVVCTQPPPPSTVVNPFSRRPSLPRLQTSFAPTSPGSAARRPYALSTKPLPLTPTPPVYAEELSCQRCYYFTARNCKGYVLGGAHGDACETCARAGFFGAP